MAWVGLDRISGIIQVHCRHGQGHLPPEPGAPSGNMARDGAAMASLGSRASGTTLRGRDSLPVAHGSLPSCRKGRAGTCAGVASQPPPNFPGIPPEKCQLLPTLCEASMRSLNEVSLTDKSISFSLIKSKQVDITQELNPVIPW